MTDNRAAKAKEKMLLLYAAGAVAFIGFFGVVTAVAWLVANLKG
jgi:hypothetical protein